MAAPRTTRLTAVMAARRMRRITRRPRARRSSLALDAMSVPLAKAFQQFVAGLPDIARAQRDHHVIGLHDIQRGVHGVVQAADIFSSAMPEGANSFRHLFRRHILDGLLRGGVDIEHENVVRLMEGSSKVVQKRLGARVSMWLKQGDDAREVTLPGGRERRPDLGWVMAVVVDDGDAAGLPALLKSPIDAGVVLQRFANGFDADLQPARYSQSRGGVQNIVETRDIQPEMTEFLAAKPDREFTGEMATAVIAHAVCSLGVLAVSYGSTVNEREHLLHVLVIEAQNGSAVKRNLINELAEGEPDVLDAGVMVQMLAIDVGDHGQYRRQLQERAIALVRLDHQKFAPAHARVAAAHRRDAPSDDNSGIHAGVAEDGGDHRRSRGFAVAAGDGDAVFETHQLGQQLAPGNDRNAEPLRLENLGVMGIDGGTDHQRAGVADVFRRVSFVHAGAKFLKALGNGGQLRVGAADLISEVEQHFGDTAHADPADAGEVEVLPPEKHFTSVLFRIPGPGSMEN